MLRIPQGRTPPFGHTNQCIHIKGHCLDWRDIDGLGADPTAHVVLFLVLYPPPQAPASFPHDAKRVRSSRFRLLIIPTSATLRAFAFRRHGKVTTKDNSCQLSALSHDPVVNTCYQGFSKSRVKFGLLKLNYRYLLYHLSRNYCEVLTSHPSLKTQCKFLAWDGWHLLQDQSKLTGGHSSEAWANKPMKHLGISRVSWGYPWSWNLIIPNYTEIEQIN